jgi:septal ring factor EnvC (AmiA/AmiB activator)
MDEWSGNLALGMLRGQTRNLDQALANWRHAEAELAKANAIIHQQNATIHGQNATIGQQNDRISELEDQLASAKMDAAGRKAQVDAMMNQHKDSPLLSDSGKRFTCAAAVGQIKTKLRLIYEAAFDSFGRDMLKISNPASWRWN